MKTQIKILNIVLIFFIAFISVADSSEKTVKEYLRILKKGKIDDKLQAAGEIIQYDIIDVSFGKPLLKSLRRGKVAKNNFVFLSAYLKVIDDEEKSLIAYKEFTKNAFSKRWPRSSNKYTQINNYLLEMVKLNPVPASLIDFLFDKKNYKKLKGEMRLGLLSEILKNNPDLASVFVARLEQSPITNIRILSVLGDEIIPYLEDIRAVLSLAPANVLDILQKHNAITEKEIDYAITLLKPLNLSNIFWGSRTTNIIAIEVLAANAGKYPQAMNEIEKIIAANNITLIKYAFDKYPTDDQQVKGKLLDAFFKKLAENVPEESTIKSEVCNFLSNFEITKEDHIEALLYATRFADNVAERNDCTFALGRINVPSDKLLTYLQNSLTTDLSYDVNLMNELNKSYHLFKFSNFSVFNPYKSPDISPLYRATNMLRYLPNHIEALQVVEKFYDADTSYIKFIKIGNMDRINQYIFDLSMAVHSKGIKNPLAVKITPFEILADNYKTRNDQRWEALIYENLTSQSNEKSMLAAYLITQSKIMLPVRFAEILVEKSKSNKFYEGIFINAMRYVPQTDGITKLLTDMADSKNENLKLIAFNILSDYDKTEKTNQ